MSSITIYGVNAVGKDSVANTLKLSDPNIFITSESRLLMYHLGIIPSFETSYRADRDAYVKLENTPQADILAVTETELKDHLIKLRAGSGETLLLSHLVFALNLDREKPVYLMKDLPEWTREVVNGFVHLKASPSEIYKRKYHDEVNRARGAMEISQIAYHQRLCDEKWEDLVRPLDAETHTIVWNHNLGKAVEEVQSFTERLR